MSGSFPKLDRILDLVESIEILIKIESKLNT